MTLIASIITFSEKKNWKKNVTLDPRHGTRALDMKPSTLDPRQKDRLSFTWSQNSPMILCRLLDCWLISNNLQDSVSVTNILPAIKTDHAAISLDFNISQNHIKGSGYWKMNCFLLGDDNYQMEVTAKMPVWLAQGRGCDLPDHRCIRDWIKHNLRAHAIQFSKRKAKEKKDKENILQDEFNNAKQNFECDPTNKNASECAERKIRTFLWRKTSRPDSRTGVMVWTEFD